MITKEISDMVNQVESYLNMVKDHYRMITSSTMLERHNTICVWPATMLTVDVLDGQARINNGYMAAQFTPEAAAAICETVSNGKGEHPVPMSPRQYYAAVIEMLERVFEDMKERMEKASI